MDREPLFLIIVEVYDFIRAVESWPTKRLDFASQMFHSEKKKIIIHFLKMT